MEDTVSSILDFPSKFKLVKGYIECHHRLPLAEPGEGRLTRLEDLARVCANCHRMLHRGISPENSPNFPPKGLTNCKILIIN